VLLFSVRSFFTVLPDYPGYSYKTPKKFVLHKDLCKNVDLPLREILVFKFVPLKKRVEAVVSILPICPLEVALRFSDSAPFNALAEI
jgi:hypothetical protein